MHLGLLQRQIGHPNLKFIISFNVSSQNWRQSMFLNPEVQCRTIHLSLPCHVSIRTPLLTLLAESASSRSWFPRGSSTSTRFTTISISHKPKRTVHSAHDWLAFLRWYWWRGTPRKSKLNI